VQTPPTWAALAAANQVNSYVTPGPNGMNARAMAIVTLLAASAPQEGDYERDAACFAQNQLRCGCQLALLLLAELGAESAGARASACRYGHIWQRLAPNISCAAALSQLHSLRSNLMGLNSARQSYFAGVAPDGAASPRQPVDRWTGPANYNDAGANPATLTGALVHGASPNGAFTDRRTAPEHTGVSLLNNSPLALLVAALRSRNLNIEDCIGLRPRERLSKTSNVADQAAAQAAAGGA
jgi:hypothetical protein